MKALMKKDAKPGLLLQEVSLPAINDDEVLIKIKTTGICGTDLHIYDWNEWANKTVPVPLILGHEFVGIITKLGKNVHHLKVGDRVSGEGHITCGVCRLCRSPKTHLCANAKGLGIQINGAFAEYLCLPARNVIRIPDDIPDDIAAILDPLGNAVHSVHSVDIMGENVLVTGAGPIGLMVVAILKQLGARHIYVTDINPFRLTLATKMGATYAIDVQKESLTKILSKHSDENNITVGLEMSGKAEAILSQLEFLTPGSTLAALGITPRITELDWNSIIFKGLTIKGIYGRELFETWSKAIALIQSGLDLSILITHHFDMKDYQMAFEVAKSGQAGKILLHWS